MKNKIKKNLDKRIKESLKKDFKLLYQKEFTSDWKEQRLIRNTEIDVMDNINVKKLIYSVCEKVMVGEHEKGIPINNMDDAFEFINAQADRLKELQKVGEIKL